MHLLHYMIALLFLDGHGPTSGRSRSCTVGGMIAASCAHLTGDSGYSARKHCTISRRCCDGAGLTVA